MKTSIETSLVFLILCMNCSTALADTPVTFEFNPVDFFDFKRPSEGFGTEGGMFRLHETGGFSGVPVHDSWDADGWATLDALRTSLDDIPDDEGIGYVQVFLLKSPDPTAPETAWGQTLTADPQTTPTGTAPRGWHVLEATESVDAWVYQWEADAPDYYVRPGEDAGVFSLSFTANETVGVGQEYTIWFGGDNYPDFTPAIDFGPFPSGFASQKPPGQIGTSYEATLSLTPVPEPSALLLLATGALGLLFLSWRRRGASAVA